MPGYNPGVNNTMFVYKEAGSFNVGVIGDSIGAHRQRFLDSELVIVGDLPKIDRLFRYIDSFDADAHMDGNWVPALKEMAIAQLLQMQRQASQIKRMFDSGIQTA